MTETTQDSGTLTTFGQLLHALEAGQLDHDAADAVRDLVAAVQDQGGEGTGKLTLELTFACKSGIVDVTGSLKVKTPNRPRGRTVLWVTPSNRLTRANPNQMGLPLRDVNAASEPKAV